MKLLNIFLLVTITILFTACKQDETTILSGEWKMIGIASSEGEIFFVKPSTEEDVILDLQEAFPTAFSGMAVCNEIYGEFKSLGGQNLKVEKFGGTQIYCPPWGPAFEDRIQKVSSYKISKGKYLYLLLDEEQLIFEKIK